MVLKVINSIRAKLRDDLVLPKGASAPIVTSLSAMSRPVLTLFISDKKEPLNALQHFIKRHLELSFLNVPGVQRMKIIGGNQTTIEIQLDLNKMLAYRINLSRVMAALKQENFVLPVSYISTKHKNILCQPE